MKLLNVRAAAVVAGVLLLSTASFGAPSDKKTIMQADQSLADALQKSDSNVVGGLLDTEFAWTDAQGATHSKARTFKDMSQFASDNRGDSGKAYFYGDLGLVYGTHHDQWFMRIWVKRPSGWRLFVDLDTPTAREPRPQGAVRNNGSKGDCDNPCRTLPYKPATPADKAVLAEWQKTKVDEWHPNADDWATHIADEFMIINNGSARDKTTRVALAKKEQAEGIGAPGAPILSMKMYDFAKAVVMISHHVPYQGGKPYYNVRVFVNRDGHWPLVWSQQTTIQSEAARPPIAAK